MGFGRGQDGSNPAFITGGALVQCSESGYKLLLVLFELFNISMGKSACNKH
jgi:hypothetical protein